MRFTSSGTESTTMAIRCSRAATGRQKIMKMEGGYHGSYEMAEVSLAPFPKNRGKLEEPNSLPIDGSFPDSFLKRILSFVRITSQVWRRLLLINMFLNWQLLLLNLFLDQWDGPCNKRIFSGS
ncbi:MAG: hypothetical protein CM1200mP12_18030 [Gammaproteobacteria bacterium]|nr:MAG: hypothetical protein CM1200mP12_18030 [Gammaproteobacteria bacterium]